MVLNPVGKSLKILLLGSVITLVVVLLPGVNSLTHISGLFAAPQRLIPFIYSGSAVRTGDTSLTVSRATRSPMGRCQISDTDSYGGQGLHILPLESHKFTVIWLHGLGDTAEGWIDFAVSLSESGGVFNDCKFILPTAKSQPITINGGMKMPAWADTRGLDPDTPDDAVGFDESARRIISIVEREAESLASLGTEATRRIIVGGFSQGGALSYTVAMQSCNPIGGAVILSGWLPMRFRYESAESRAELQKKKGVPFLHCHGSSDDIVAIDWGKKSYEYVKQLLGMDIEFRTYDMGHSGCPQETRDVTAFVRKALKVAGASVEC